MTATIGFVDGQRENERFSRNETHVKVRALAASDVTLTDNAIAVKTGNPAYLVKIENGNLSKDVLIDAFTGNILKA